MKMPTRRSIQDEALASENLLELVPVRVATWQEVEDRVVVERPRPRMTGLQGVGERVSHFLSMRMIRSVAEVAVAMRERFGEEVEPAEERVGQLIRMLRRERLLAYPGWDPAPTGSMPREREGNEC